MYQVIFWNLRVESHGKIHDLITRRETFSRAQGQALGRYWKVTCRRRHTPWLSKASGEGAPARRAAGWADPGKLLPSMACRLQYYGNGVCFWVSSGQSYCHIWPDSGSLLVVYTSQPRWIFDWGFRKGWQDILWGWYLLLDPPKLFLVLVEALCSSSIPTFMKQLMQVVISRPGQAGQF